MLNIVFCDDNSQFLVLLRSVVENECRKIIPKEEERNIGPAFDSGEELIEYMKDNHVDVVLLDIDMPNMNGFEVARYLCKEHKNVKIVFMSFINCLKGICSSLKKTFPLSILDISKISLIRESKNFAETSILFKQSSTEFESFIESNARLVIPIIAFIGVRIS